MEVNLTANKKNSQGFGPLRKGAWRGRGLVLRGLSRDLLTLQEVRSLNRGGRPGSKVLFGDCTPGEPESFEKNREARPLLPCVREETRKITSGAAQGIKRQGLHRLIRRCLNLLLRDNMGTLEQAENRFGAQREKNGEHTKGIRSAEKRVKGGTRGQQETSLLNV